MDPDQPQSERADTAAAPIIRGEPVEIPTPVWGALLEEDRRRIAESGLEQQEFDPPDPGFQGGPVSRSPRLLGWLSVAAFVVTAVLHGTAVAVAGYVDPVGGTVLAWAAIIVSLGAIGLGVTAAVLGRGRWLGVIGAAGGFLANPWIVLHALRLFGG